MTSCFYNGEHIFFSGLIFNTLSFTLDVMAMMSYVLPQSWVIIICSSNNNNSSSNNNNDNNNRFPIYYEPYTLLGTYIYLI